MDDGWQWLRDAEEGAVEQIREVEQKTLERISKVVQKVTGGWLK